MWEKRYEPKSENAHVGECSPICYCDLMLSIIRFVHYELNELKMKEQVIIKLFWVIYLFVATALGWSGLFME
jgi:hypothetical protein